MKRVFHVVIVGFFLPIGLACSPVPKANLLSSGPDHTPTQVLFDFLKSLPAKKQFIFGQQRASLVGIGEYGDRPWTDSGYGGQTDVEAYTGQKVGMIGIDIWDLAMKNPTWNQAVYSQSIRDFYDAGRGGVITLDWHMRGCSVKPVADINGNLGIQGDGFKIHDWDKDEDADCLCRIVNDEPWENGLSWKDWYISQKLEKFHQMLVKESLTSIPLIYRPFHEQTGSWFWWGARAWNCADRLGRDDALSGPDAYKALFRLTVEYLRKNKGLQNLLIAFSPDKLCKHEGHTCSEENARRDNPTPEELRADYLSSYPGDDAVDILGIDLYYAQNFGQPWEAPDYQTALFTRYLQTVTSIAQEKGKVAALTETGNYNLHQDARVGSQWFTGQLLAMLSDPKVQISYVLTWENRKPASTEYYIPHRGHADFQDFLDFVASPSTLLYNDIAGLYAAKDYPDCASAANDPDGDGWGWENDQSCRVQEQDGGFPRCSGPWTDPDGDGWGWENNRSCRV